MRGAVATAPAWPDRLAGAAVALAAVVVYANSLAVPFVFDDIAAVHTNPTIRRLGTALAPPDGLSVTGRPLANVSLALSYALSGTAPWGYHLINIALHALAGAVLFGSVRRTLLKPPLRERFGGASRSLALVVALVWTVHPVQTASVTYVMQRTEVLAGLCYLLTLYCFIRSVEGAAPRRWQAAAGAACLAGMASKEVMVTAPVVVLLYDRTFVAGSVRGALRQRWPLHVGLAATWLVLGALVLGTGSRGASAGLAASVAWWAYGLTQLRAIVLYLRLAVWPRPLVFDYGTAVAASFADVAWPAAGVALLVAGGALAWRRWPAMGFAGAWLFAILAPSSSVVPIATQTVAEHRMYLPLAALVALAVLGTHVWLGQRSLAAWVVVTVVFGGLALRRNTDYRSELALWRDTAAKAPANARAHYNLGVALAVAGQIDEAMAEYAEALRLEPDHARAHYKLGSVLLERGNLPEARAHLEAAVRDDPRHAEAHANLGRALVLGGRLPEAIAQFGEALRLQPDLATAHNDLGNALLASGRAAEALPHFEEVEKLSPGWAEAQFNLGNACVQLGRLADAARHYEDAVRLEPAYAAAHYNLGNALTQLGRYDEALTHYLEASRLDPHNELARSNGERLRAYLGRPR